MVTKNFVLLNRWRQRCSPLQIIEPLTSKDVRSAARCRLLNNWRQKTSEVQPAADYCWRQKTSEVQPAADYWTIEVKDYWTIDRENLGTRLCYLRKREMAAFERRKSFESIIKRIIEFGFRRIWRILQVEEGVIHRGPISTKMDSSR